MVKNCVLMSFFKFTNIGIKKILVLFFILNVPLNVNAHGVSPVVVDAGFKAHGMRFPVKIRVYNNNSKAFPAEVFIKKPDNTLKILGETTPIQPGGYDKGVDINVILNALNGTTKICTKMKSDNLNINTIVCTKVKVKTPGEMK
ncbi:hypothetical protein [Photobacterium sanguinicancri]|uniref:hypothetical protein n=1 Tax=Photobacterium sanguinicancri TaxID=875932 RepID=UPI0021C3E3E4|nr:hypothetical protein [Photobacterium sanguinicancri]